MRFIRRWHVLATVAVLLAVVAVSAASIAFQSQARRAPLQIQTAAADAVRSGCFDDDAGKYSQFADSDQDGVPDLLENYRYGLDFGEADSDSDGLPDCWEARYQQDVRVAGLTLVNPDPTIPDAFGTSDLPDADVDGWDMDGNGIITFGEQFPNGREFGNGTNPNLPDTDGDGLLDGWEAKFRTYGRATTPGTGCPDPLVTDASRDCDGDGLANLFEAAARSNPWDSDSDDDGLSDADEVGYDGDPGYSPFDPVGDVTGTDLDPTRADTDRDGMPDGWEVRYQFDPLSRDDVTGDPDGDGLANLLEARADTDPLKGDTDLDGMPDGWEVAYRLDPRHDDGARDNDTDTLSNRREFEAGSRPNARDTDGDGLGDADEINGWNVRINGALVRVVSHPARIDSDADGLLDRIEHNQTRTNPSAADSDGDGLLDQTELGDTGTDPVLSDSDDDALDDGDEMAFWTTRHEIETERVHGGDVTSVARLQSFFPWVATMFADDPATLPVDVIDAAFLPIGDLDGDGQRNILDPDSDNDDMLSLSRRDGQEIHSNATAATARIAAELAAWETSGGAWYDNETSHWVGPTGPRAAPTFTTDPADPDTDLDGMPDGWEVRNLLHPSWGGDAAMDADNDTFLPPGVVRDTPEAGQAGFGNLREYLAGTHPRSADSDHDGLGDGWEWFYGIRPLRDGQAAVLDPSKADTDSDGVEDPDEDPDEAGTPRGCFYDRNLPASAHDAARCTLSWDSSSFVVFWFDFDNQAEFLAGTDPLEADTDRDGIPDGWEVRHSAPHDCGDGTLRFMSALRADAASDTDCDELTNVQEYEWVQNPVESDTDGDGLTDGFEINQVRSGQDPTPPRHREATS